MAASPSLVIRNGTIVDGSGGDPYEADLAITDGKISDANFVDVPMVRFRKQLTTRTPKSFDVSRSRPRDLVQAKEHTVFVVQANSLLDFVTSLELDKDVARSI